jgi:hypothetical protein
MAELIANQERDERKQRSSIALHYCPEYRTVRIVGRAQPQPGELRTTFKSDVWRATNTGQYQVCQTCQACYMRNTSVGDITELQIQKAQVRQSNKVRHACVFDASAVSKNQMFKPGEANNNSKILFNKLTTFCHI